jgi:hypothetical protein
MTRVNIEKEEPVHLLPCCPLGCWVGEILSSHVRTENNFSDFMMKVTYRQKWRHLVGSVPFDIYDDHWNKKSRLTESTAE